MTTTTTPTPATATVGQAGRAAGGFGSRAADLLTDAATYGWAGAAAGFIALGIGSRVAMRLVALSSGQIGTGVRPESGAVPGTFSMGGTMFLVLSGTVIGAVLAVLIGALLGRWLPAGAGRRTFVLAAVASLVPVLMLVDPTNTDFVLFGPRWLAVVLFVVCAGGYGALLASLARRTRTRRPGFVGVVTLLFGAGALVLVLAVTVALGTEVIVVVPLVLALIAGRLVPSGGRLGWWHAAGVQRGGEWVLTAFAIVAAGLAVSRGGSILLA